MSVLDSFATFGVVSVVGSITVLVAVKPLTLVSLAVLLTLVMSVVLVFWFVMIPSFVYFKASSRRVAHGAFLFPRAKHGKECPHWLATICRALTWSGCVRLWRRCPSKYTKRFSSLGWMIHCIIFSLSGLVVVVLEVACNSWFALLIT